MRYLLIVPLLFCASPVLGAEFTVLRPQQSSITFVSKQMGVPVEGNFRKFAARIAVDPARLEAGTAHIDIELASIDTGNTEVDTEVAGKAWFDTKNHPVASFVSGGVKDGCPTSGDPISFTLVYGLVDEGFVVGAPASFRSGEVTPLHLIRPAADTSSAALHLQ